MPNAEEAGPEQEGGKSAPPPSPDRSGENQDPAFGEKDTASVVQVLRDLQERLDHAYSIREALEADIEAANVNLSALQGQNDALRKRVEFLETRDKLAVQLQSELDFLHEEKASSVKTIRTLESRVSDLTQRKTTLEKDVKASHSALADMKRKAVELQMKVVQLQDKAAAMGEVQSLLTETKEQLAQATDRVRDLESELDTQSIAREASERNLRRIQRVAEELRREIAELKSTHETLETEKRTLRSKLLASEYENKRLQDQSKSTDIKLTEALKEKADFRKKLVEAQQTLADVQNALESTREKMKKRWASRAP
ncbi:MAG: hypothetical protein ACYTHM_00790 [Planctomycetota bacterium]|jgi:chromosome segregation ATPase